VIATYGGGGTVEGNRKIVEICLKHNPVCMRASVREGGRNVTKRYMRGWRKRLDRGTWVSSTLEEIAALEKPTGVGAVYDSREAVQGVIKELGEGDFGRCVVVSGVFDEVFDMCKNAPVAYAHTINMSAETFGRLELLPEPAILEFTTMCGHHFVSPHLVKHLINEVKEGRWTAEDAAVELGKACRCNFFNVSRAVKLINKNIASS
jgi:hypothetical protein